MNAARILLVSCWIFVSASCAIAPAKVARLFRPDDAGMHAQLRQALAEPDSSAGKAALGHFIEQWRRSGMATHGEVNGSVNGRRHVYRVSFPVAESGSYPVDYFDEISPAVDFAVKKIPHHTRDGVGVPLVALRENRGREPIEAFYPPEVISRPLTAVARPGVQQDGFQDVRIDLLCPLRNSSVEVDGRRRPLAADFSLPWAATLARAGKLHQLRVLDMITPKPRRASRLYLMEPYDPRKEPLIMIHGLLSTPLTWAELSNDLWSDDDIRGRYQIWHYLYNTSAPSLFSSRELRMQLHELRELLDPAGDDPAMQRTTLLTHSMGGLVGKALAQEPGDALWKAAFRAPPEKLRLPAADRAQLQEAFDWKADRTIHRVIFIATPHRGSSFADNLIGRIGAWLTKPPDRFQDFYTRIAAANPGVFAPEHAMSGSRRLNSVSLLSPRQPMLRILAGLPFKHAVHVHSIIGDRGRSGPLEESSDGVVPYTSSHIEGADSELVVPCNHRAFRHPDAVAEIRRILKL